MFNLLPFPWNLVAKVVAVLAAVAAVVFAWHHYVASPYIEEGVARQAVVTAKVQKEFDDYKKAAEEKTARANEEIKAGIADLEATKVQLTKERNVRIAKFEERAKALPASVADQPVSAVAVSVLNDAIRSSNAESAGAAAQPREEAAAAATDSTVGAFTVWGVQVTKQYAECVDQVGGLQDLWNRTRLTLDGGGP